VLLVLLALIATLKDQGEADEDMGRSLNKRS